MSVLIQISYLRPWARFDNCRIIGRCQKAFHALTLVTCHFLSCPWMNRHKYHSSRRRLTLFVSFMYFADVLNCTATPGGTEPVEKKSTGRVLLCRISVSRG